jgi:hypothetical protein
MINCNEIMIKNRSFPFFIRALTNSKNIVQTKKIVQTKNTYDVTQVAAMLSILVRYNWQQFSIVTSEIAGHDDFVQV